MTDKAWIISGSDGELRPGLYRARLGRDEPFVAVELLEDVDRDEETGAAMNDAVYRLFIDGAEITDFQTRFAKFGLIGWPIEPQQYAEMRGVVPRAADKGVKTMTTPTTATAEAPKGMHLVRLEAENVKKLKAVCIEPDGSLVQITGRNFQGKTTVLDVIGWAIAGKDGIQSKPIRTGQDEAVIKLNLGDVIVRRTFKNVEGGGYTTSVTVENGEGARYKSPQSMLDDLFATLAFDPLDFVRQDPDKQVETLRRIAKVDLDFDNLSALSRGDFERRTEINRQAKALRAQAEGIAIPATTPAAKVDTKALLDAITNAGTINAEIESRRQRRQKVADAAAEFRASSAKKRADASALRLQAEELETGAADDDEAATGQDERLASAEPLPDLVDISATRTELDAAEGTNKAVADAERKAQLVKDAVAKEAEAAELTAKMDAREQVKADAIAQAEMPVPGLGFGDGIVTFNNEPFDQASSAEQIRVSVAIAMAGNPKLRVVRIKEGSLLDSSAMAIIAKMAQDNDFQVWVEKVDETGKVGIVIEDGAVVAINPNPEALPVKATPKARRAAAPKPADAEARL